MSAPRHVYDIYIKATPEAVWQALTDPAFTVKYFYGNTVESTFVKGDGYRYLLPDGQPAIEGVIDDIDPGRRLVMTFRFLYDPAMAEEPPSRIEWVIKPAGDVTRLTLVHGDLFKSPLTWETTKLGWVHVLGAMKTYLETGEEMGEVREFVGADAAASAADPEGEWHRAQGIAANNATWDWLGKADGERSAEDDEQMTMAAYAAAYHWGRASRRGPENDTRAAWMLSRVWVVRGNGDLALHYARRAADICAASGLTDFDLAYAHEATARALACLGRGDEARAERDVAGAVPVADDEDRSIFESDLRSEPWFGI